MLKGSLEDNVLTLLCWSDQHSPNLAMQLVPGLFSTRVYQDVAAKALAHIERFAVPPRAHLRDLCEAQLRKGDEGALTGRVLDAMEELYPELQPEYVLDQLDRFISLRKLSQAVEAAAVAVDGGDLEAARDALYVTEGKPTGSPGIYLHEPDQALEFLVEREDDYFPSGIGLLDEMGIRPTRKTMTLLIAAAKRGKSWYLINVGRRAMLTGRNVLHVTLENSEELTAKRYVQSMYGMANGSPKAIRVPIFRRDESGRTMGIDFDTVMPEGLTVASRARVAKKLKKLGTRGRLKIKEFPMGSLTLAQLNAYIDMLARVEGFVPDMLIVDYPDKMAINADKIRTDTGQMFTGLRGMATARNMAVVVVTQGNRVAGSSRTTSATMVAEDYSKIGTADTILTYSQTSEEKGLNLARIMVAAARDAEDQFVVLISQSYPTGQFCLDSVYLAKHMETEVKRLTGEDDGTSE